MSALINAPISAHHWGSRKTQSPIRCPSQSSLSNGENFIYLSEYRVLSILVSDVKQQLETLVRVKISKGQFLAKGVNAILKSDSPESEIVHHNPIVTVPKRTSLFKQYFLLKCIIMKFLPREKIRSQSIYWETQSTGQI